MSEHISRLNSALEGRYAIQGEIGEGGMATVYLARDLKHNRKVALKVLRPDLAAVVGAERFLTEIETTANLQHPHILPLFDSGEADGFLFYVMPFVEGESLRDRLEREEQLPVDEAVRIAIDVAEALQVAHDQGVIHRDIKPANILLSGGRPLIADFGIALAVSAAGGGRLTETGLSLGTPFYMSPEQASADRQPSAASDVYSLGCVLYEMLVGEPPYTGGSAQAVLAKILTADATAPTTTRPTVPPNVDAAIRRAIEKLPADRFRSASDFAAALRDDGFRHRDRVAVAADDASERPTTTRRVVLVSVAAGIVALGAGVVIGRLTTPEPSRTLARFELDVPEEVIGVSACCGPEQALSPDGSWLVFRGETGTGEAAARLYRRRLGSLEAEVIPGTEGATMPFFSPDGAWLGFHADGRLRRLPMGGGPSVPITDVGRAEGASWGDDDVIVLSQNDGPLYTVPSSGGVPTEVPNPQGLNLIHPSVLPGGGFTLARSREDTPEEARIWVIDLESGEAEAIGYGTYAVFASGHVVFSGADGTLLAQPFDPAARRTTGPAVAILDGVARAGPSLGEFTLSDQGGLVYQFGSAAEADEVLMLRGARGASEVPLSDVGVDLEEPSFSPDGQRIAVSVLIDGRRRIWIWDRRQETQQLLSVGDEAGEEHRVPVWHPDGSRVAYGVDHPETQEEPAIYVQRVDGSGSAQRLTETEYGAVPQAWTPDGERLLFWGWRGDDRSIDIGVVSEGDLEIEWLVQTEGRDAQPVVSADGRWLAFSSTRSGQSEVFVQALDGVGGMTQISAGGGHSPRWAPDGQGLYYASWEAGSLILASLDTEDGIRVTDRVAAFPLPTDLNPETVNWDVSPDGEEIVYISQGELEDAITFVWVLNWTELADRRGALR